MGNAIIYCRVSTWNQVGERSHSLGFQLSDCMEYCQENNMRVRAVFTDIQTAWKPHLLHGRRQAVRMSRIESVPIIVQWADRFSRIADDEYPPCGIVITREQWLNKTQEQCERVSLLRSQRMEVSNG